ncbi:SMP-30/gluconolactonase/LRE family protein [Chelatococcus asaccharovorans]|uniref:Gluconolactonase n=1 Tax=Chelatococcus asaccharovorans TaxID=28210 RepID=A0A2V3U7C7_9HYPH|nr:SMP-30/gluconolactonase/LRE family protein [Chelatococcus asaccharovorans]MBS7706049.1 SMP-30/gluconolactonase/LRE family protein [Chelatococcus asaccharovorans]PXW59072.1 gluconolactonase [Chelatococcus asaccharovorans]
MTRPLDVPREALRTRPDPDGRDGRLAVAATVTFTEGPTCDRAGTLYFSDVRGNRILRLRDDGDLALFRYPANFANGMVCDPQDRLWICEEGEGEGGREARISCTDLATGEERITVAAYGGRRFRGPKDITFDSRGRIYFTDGSRPFFLADRGDPATLTPGSAVYRIDPDGTVVRILDHHRVREPNGIVVSPDDATLYLVENDPRPGGIRRLLAFALDETGAAGEGRVLHDFGDGRSADGLSVDRSGRLWVAAGLNALRGLAETLANRAGVYVFEPSGALVEMIAVPEDTVTNTCFGGPDRRTLFVTAGKTIYRLRTEEAGLGN